MPSYKLTYFNGRGRAENIRLCFAAAGVKYEDKRIDAKEWQQLKPKTTHGFLPVLEVDGKSLSQSTAILCFVASAVGLNGKDKFESGKVHEVICTVNDFIEKLIKVVFEKDETKKADAMKDLLAEAVPKTLNILKNTLGGKLWLVGSEMTAADLVVYNSFEDVVTMAKEQGMDIFAEYRALEEHANRVKNTPKIKKWLETRPVTSF